MDDLEDANGASVEEIVDQVQESFRRLLSQKPHGGAINALTCVSRMLELGDKVSAADLRNMGFEIDEKIPDCAWVPRTAVTISGPEAMKLDESEQRLSMCLSCEISVPFHWVECEFSIDGTSGDLDE